MERHLTTLFGIVESTDLKNFEAPAAPKRKGGWLPLLTVLFLISYGLMTMLIVEQGRTIESQRTLIQELFGDSAQLSAMKLKASVEHAQAAQAQSALPQLRKARHPRFRTRRPRHQQSRPRLPRRHIVTRVKQQSRFACLPVRRRTWRTANEL
jgi:hypothetical protein